MCVWIFYVEMDEFSDHSDVELLSQLPEEDVLNTAVDTEEGFEAVLQEIRNDEQKDWPEPQEILLDDVWVPIIYGLFVIVSLQFVQDFGWEFWNLVQVFWF